MIAYVFQKYPKNFVFQRFIAACQGGFIVPHVWEIVVRKNLTPCEGFMFWFDRVFRKSRQRVSTPAHAFSNLLNWKGYHLLNICLTVFTLEEVRRQ